MVRRNLPRLLAPCVIAALLVVLPCAFARAASPSSWANLAEPVFVRIDTRELPEDVVEAVAQDSAGFVWIGTQGGLARYDGYHFKNYLPDPSDPKALPDGYIRSMLADANGLWLGTDSSGLVRFDAATELFRTWRADPAGKLGPRSATVYALAQGPDGALWIAGDAGLDRFDPSGGAFERADLLPRGRRQPPVHGILVDRDHTVWAASDDGLYYRSARDARFHRFAFPRPEKSTQRMFSLYEDRAGNLWVGSVDALFMLDRGRHLTATYASSPGDAATLTPGLQRCLIETTPGVVWAGSSDGGISIIDRATGRTRRIVSEPRNPNGLPGGRLFAFVRDRSGLIWIANHSGGLLLYNPLDRGAYVLSVGRPDLGLGDSGADSLEVAPGRLWVGGAHSLVALEPDAARAIRIAVPNRSTVVGLNTGRDGTLWIGTLNGLCALPRASSTARCPAGPGTIRSGDVVWAVLETGTTRWIGTDWGLLAEDMRSGKVTVYHRGDGPHGLTSDVAGTLYLDREGRIWVGTANGLNRIDPGSRRVTRFAFDPDDANSIGPGSVESILEDRRGRLWVAMNGGPLDVMQRTANGTVRFRRLGRSDGLPHENVDGLAEDARGRIWASTDRGMALIDPDTLRARAIGLADGVLSSDYWGGSVRQSPDGTMFFGAHDGITVIAPGAAFPWTYVPPLVLTALTAGGRSVPTFGFNTSAPRSRTGIELPAGARDVSAEFAGLDYSNPQALQYEYELEGYDRSWIAVDVAHRVATYTNLSPGTYVLRVRGTNRLGVWSDREIALRIVALPAWYETWWFRATLGALFVIALFGVLQLRTAALRKRSRELEATVRDRTRALEEMTISDPLTGLRNRRFLMQNLAPDAALAVRHGDRCLLFFMIDIDHFKAINDAFGHHAGDQVLVQMRERLERVFRESDYLVRWGGEEFLAVARGSARGDAEEIAERVRDAVGSRPFSLDAEHSVSKTASVGFAAFPFIPSTPGAVSWSQTIELADKALYLAKASGRNAWCGLAAGPSTDPDALIAHLANPPDDFVRSASVTLLKGPT